MDIATRQSAGGAAETATTAVPARPLGRRGDLEVRLAAPDEVRRAQRLRYRVFFEEGPAVADPPSRKARLDADAFDALCDHLIVLDHGARPTSSRATRTRVVATTRLLRQEIAERAGGFYAGGEFEIAPLLQRHRGTRFLEVGRSCIRRDYRGRGTVELLWQGIWAYAVRHRVGAMIGCASLDGTDPDRLALPLAFLHHHAGSPPEWRVRALPERLQRMDLLALNAVEPRRAMRCLPPLIKGYLRVGASFGEGAVIDRQFGTTDVFAVLPVEAISPRYIAHFGPSANRYPA